MNTIKREGIPLAGTTTAMHGQTVFPVLAALSFTHLLNDTLQSIVPAMYPLLKDSFQLSFTEIGMITFVFQISASILQPLVGLYTDKRPQPYALAVGMTITLAGLTLLALTGSFTILLLSVAFMGIGSAIFHPEASRLARMASGGRHGMAQSFFQVGGNAGTSFGPLLAAAVIIPFGRGQTLWFSLMAILAIGIFIKLGSWYSSNLHLNQKKSTKDPGEVQLSRRKIVMSIGILLMLIFSKYIYMTSLNSYFTFYMIDKFNVSIQDSQLYLFAFLFSVAAGTYFGGPLGDRIGRKYVIWISILGAAPFALLLPYANLFWTCALSCIIGMVISSAFSAILVYAQELIPGKVGMIAGLFFGFAFGMAGIGSAVLGIVADKTSIAYVFSICSFLPLIGLLTGFLPDLERRVVPKA